MNIQVEEYMNNYSVEIIDMFYSLRQIILDSVACEPKEVMWAKLPSYYVGDSFVRLIPFMNHINIEAQAVISHEKELSEYSISPKGMLQIYVKQDIPSEILEQIFVETLA